MCWQSRRDIADNDKVLSTKFANLASFRYVVLASPNSMYVIVFFCCQHTLTQFERTPGNAGTS